MGRLQCDKQTHEDTRNVLSFYTLAVYRSAPFMMTITLCPTNDITVKFTQLSDSSCHPACTNNIHPQPILQPHSNCSLHCYFSTYTLPILVF